MVRNRQIEKSIAAKKSDIANQKNLAAISNNTNAQQTAPASVDGNVDELTPNGISRAFTHEYTDQNLKAILINTESLTSININDGKSATLSNGTYRELWFGDCPELKEIECDYRHLTALEIKGCTALTGLYCGNNQLTSLDVSKNTALTNLGCESNQLSSSALNALFNSLPKVTNGSIAIYGNPGASG